MEKNVINSKVSMIDVDGQVYMVGRVNDPSQHVKCLLSLLNYKYPDTQIGSLTYGNVRDRLAYQLCEFGNIVYLNDITFGMVYFPNEVTDKQLNTIYSLDLDNKQVMACYNLKEIGKNINFRTIGVDGSYNLKEVTEEYLEKTKIRTRRK